MRSLVLAAAVLGLVRCAAGAPPAGGPAAPNQSTVTAEVVDAAVVDSSTLDIAPAQPLCLLTLRLLSIRAVEGFPDALHGRSGETIRALSRDVGLVGLKGRTVTASLSLRGDERSGRFWVVGTPAPAPGAR